MLNLDREMAEDYPSLREDHDRLHQDHQQVLRENRTLKAQIASLKARLEAAQRFRPNHLLPYCTVCGTYHTLGHCPGGCMRED